MTTPHSRDSLPETGRPAPAAGDFLDAMQQGLAAEDGGDLTAAARLYRAGVAMRPHDGVPYLYLAQALFRAGLADLAAQVTSLGCDLAPGIIGAWRRRGMDALVAERSRFVDERYRAHMTRLQALALEQFEARHGRSPVRLRSLIWCQTHDQPFEFRDPRQRPWLLFVPELAPRPWFESEELEGAATMEAAAGDIRQEALAALGALRDRSAPYVRSADRMPDSFGALEDSPDWSALHLYRVGQPAEPEVLEAFPETLRAVSATGCVRLGGQPMELFLSVLAPGTRIPPHYGLANTRLTVHLPLLVPEACHVEVAGQRRAPVPGRLMAFDDSFEHAAANLGDDRRVHLIFEAWRPDLDDFEREAVSWCIEQRDEWNRGRQLPPVKGWST